MTFLARYTSTSDEGLPYTIGLRLNGELINGSLATSHVVNTSISNMAIFTTGEEGGALDLFIFDANQNISLKGYKTSLQIVRLS